MKAVVLAAGRGTRLRPLTDVTPKPMIDLWGRPILEHVLRGLALAGLREVGIVTAYLGEQIEDYFAGGARLGLSLSYYRQTEKPGTVGAVLAAERFVGEEPFFACFADIITDYTVYKGVLDSFAAEPCDALLALNWVDDPSAGSAVYVEGTRIVRQIEKPAPGTSTTHWNQAGIFVYGPEMLRAMRRVTPSPRGEYELPSATQILLSENRLVRGYLMPRDTLWSDVGTLEELERLNALAGTQPGPLF